MLVEDRMSHDMMTRSEDNFKELQTIVDHS